MKRVQKRLQFLHIGLMILFFAGTSLALANDWPQWRGPHANNISDETGWNPKALNNPKIPWKVNIGDGHCTVSVVGDRIYTLGYAQHGEGEKAAYEEIVFCLDAKSGREIWRYAYPCTLNRFPGPAGSPAVQDDRLYTMGRDGECICFQAQDGMVLWKRNLVQDGLGQKPQWGFCNSPVITGDLLLINIGESGAALNKNTGKIVWSSEPNLGWLAAPLLFDWQGKKLAAISSNRALYAVDPKDGKVAWSHPWHSNADPVLLGDKILLTGGRAGQACTLLDISEKEPKVIWQNRQLANAFQAAIVVDGHIYGFGRERNSSALVCMSLETGDVKWTESLGDWGSLMAADGKLIIVDGQGDLIIAEANPNKYTAISSARVLPQEDWQQTDHDRVKTCWTTPVLANGHIYVRNTWGELACVAMK